MSSFQAKIGWKMPRKRKNKNYRSVSFNPTRNWTFQKNSNIIEKIKVYHYGFLSSQNRLGKAEKDKKLKLSVRSLPTRRVIENSKKIVKKFKKLKNIVMASFQAKIGWKRMKKRENKNYHSVPLQYDAKLKIPKK